MNSQLQLEKITDTVFRASHFEVFATLICLRLAESIVEDILPVAAVILSLISKVVSQVWILLLGYGLSKRQGDVNSVQFGIFIWTGILGIIINFVFDVIIAATGFELDLEKHMISIGSALVYGLFYLVIIFTYPARMLRLLEMKREVGIKDYFGDIFLLLIWPIGIWTIQPRINRLADFKSD